MTSTLQIQGFAICNGTVSNSSNDQTLITKNYADNLFTNAFAVGTIKMYAGTSFPSGWLFCDGQTLDASANPQYEALYNVIGFHYGGTGISDFNLPNLSQKIPIGSSSQNQIYVNYQNSNTFVTGGNKTLTVNQLPSHSHTFSHTHTYEWSVIDWTVENETNAATTNVSPVDGAKPANASDSPQSGTTTTATLQSGNTGNTTDFLPPFTVVNFIIYYGG